MTYQYGSKLEELRAEVAAAIAAHRTLFIVEGVIIAVLGVAAAAMPHITTLAIEILIGSYRSDRSRSLTLRCSD
jgi:uncharacterized membrane protein HdeD (DUF308 family)